MRPGLKVATVCADAVGEGLGKVGDALGEGVGDVALVQPLSARAATM
jgi:hypothetical protein